MKTFKFILIHCELFGQLLTKHKFENVLVYNVVHFINMVNKQILSVCNKFALRVAPHSSAEYFYLKDLTSIPSNVL